MGVHVCLAARRRGLLMRPLGNVIVEFKQRRDFLLPALERLGFEIAVKPQGAFYIYANCERFTENSFNWVKNLLNEQGVAITPGIDFGTHLADKHCRFAYTQSLEKLEQAVDKIDAFIRK